MKSEEIIGKRFGKLLAVEVSGSIRDKLGRKRGKIIKCTCDCGKSHNVSANHLSHGRIKSCGCSKIANMTKHGMFRTSEYNAWRSMKQRCFYKKHSSYENYGGRGIKVCRRWQNSFKNFLADMGLKPTPIHTLERKKNDGNYTPSNCFWATRCEQQNNTRSNHVLKHNGRTQTVTQWAREIGVSDWVIFKRIKMGWSVRKALTPKIHKNQYA